MKIEMGVGWLPDKDGMIRTATPGEYVERIAQLEAELALARTAAWMMMDLCTCARVSQADVDKATLEAREIVRQSGCGQ